MLKIGEKAPDFLLPDMNGKKYRLSDFFGQKIVLYFYPKDNTSGCTLQALNYKDFNQEFINKNVKVIGISKDSEKSHMNFVNKYQLPFLLLSDTHLVAIKSYDVWHEKKLYGKTYMGVVRTTYLIDENGIIIDSLDKVDVKKDAKRISEKI